MVDLVTLARGMTGHAEPLDVTIVMPCLDEASSLPTCIANAHRALEAIARRYGLAGEIVIADNGSTDGSQDIALSLGARVVPVARRGYGAAISGGANAALGRFLLIGDADGSYDFEDGVVMIGALVDGADLCMGSRLSGGIAPGAMPWKNRYIGNPVLTGLLNLLFRSGVDDAHCGLRAIRREAFDALRLSGDGMEFASEMIVKASLKRLRIVQAPATLSPDLRDRGPHLRPWRDGWRHLRYLMMLSPAWTFGLPAVLGGAVAAVVLAVALLHHGGLLAGDGPFGDSWAIGAGFLATIAHAAAIMGVAAHVFGVREGYRLRRRRTARLARIANLEAVAAFGMASTAIGTVLLGIIAVRWRDGGFAAPDSVLPMVVAAVLCATGIQSIFGAFVIAIAGGHSTRFVAPRGDA